MKNWKHFLNEEEKKQKISILFEDVHRQYLEKNKISLTYEESMLLCEGLVFGNINESIENEDSEKSPEENKKTFLDRISTLMKTKTAEISKTAEWHEKAIHWIKYYGYLHHFGLIISMIDKMNKKQKEEKEGITKQEKKQGITKQEKKEMIKFVIFLLLLFSGLIPALPKIRFLHIAIIYTINMASGIITWQAISAVVEKVAAKVAETCQKEDPETNEKIPINFLSCFIEIFKKNLDELKELIGKVVQKAKENIKSIFSRQPKKEEKEEETIKEVQTYLENLFLKNIEKSLFIL